MNWSIASLFRPVFGIAALGVIVGMSGATAAQQRGVLPTVNERIEDADRVVVARARSVSAMWQENSHGDRLIVSRVLLQVEETLKGLAEETVAMEVPGGTLDGVTLRVSGQPLMQPGARAVFFLDRGASGVHTLHRRGEGMLPLDENDVVRGSNARLNDIRALARSTAQERVR